MTRLVQMRLPDDLVARVDEVAGPRGRTEFTIRALEAALDGGKAVPEPEKPEQVAASSAHCKERILGVLTGPRSILQISRSTAIFPGRIEKEVRALEKAGLVRWVDGMVERV